MRTLLGPDRAAEPALPVCRNAGNVRAAGRLPQQTRGPDLDLEKVARAPVRRLERPLRRHHAYELVAAIVVLGAQQVADLVRHNRSITLRVVRMEAGNKMGLADVVQPIYSLKLLPGEADDELS